ncbi:transketolase [Microbacterium lushaniae]|nr:transketolase [Microbacterium lushaniae]KAA9155233.1 transketolase [Microbacterium lushaniae]
MLQTDHDAAAVWRARRAEVRALPPQARGEALESVARGIRRDVLEMISAAGQGHIGGDYSVTDILTVLFHSVLDVDPEAPLAPDRDIFILSKGHAAASLYATLASAGFFSRDALASFMTPLSELNGHPAKTKVPGVETSTGPLGHGLPVAVGAALGRRLSGSTARTVVVTGDGEMQEGSNWEAIMSASHFALDRLVLIVDRNRLQQGARTEETNGLDPLDRRLDAFGWEVRSVDGHDLVALEEALQPSTTGRPVAVVAATVKGKGVSFIEDRVEWHHKVPSADQVAAAQEELA